MQNLLASRIGQFRIVAFLEGCSYLLLAVTMPLKYLYNMPGPNFVVGLAHGVLFMLYVAMLLWLAWQYKWPLVTLFWSLVAALLPFGTFIADKKIFSKQHELAAGR